MLEMVEVKPGKGAVARVVVDVTVVVDCVAVADADDPPAAMAISAACVGVALGFVLEAAVTAGVGAAAELVIDADVVVVEVAVEVEEAVVRGWRLGSLPGTTGAALALRSRCWVAWAVAGCESLPALGVGCCCSLSSDVQRREEGEPVPGFVCDLFRFLPISSCMVCWRKLPWFPRELPRPLTSERPLSCSPETGPVGPVGVE